jgi:hypothetical protein
MIDDERQDSLAASTSDCPGPARFWAVTLGDDSWKPDERRHVEFCPRCRSTESQVQAAVARSGADAEFVIPDWPDPTVTRAPGSEASRALGETISPEETFETETFGVTRPLSSPLEGDRLAVPTTIGHYELIKMVGKGGMGSVYQARDTRLDRNVALKVSHARAPHDHPAMDRFFREARILASLQHASIVPILDVGQVGDRTYTASPFVEGRSLSERLSIEDRIPAREAASLMADVADAVHHAHDRGILHRDIKPANILLRDDGRPMLLDFGLARAEDVEASITGEGHVFGTASYMAPEQAMGARVGPAADIYSLGATLYALLTGQPPHRAATVFETLEQVRYQEVVPPSRLNPAIDRDLEVICLKAMEKDAARRYATARELADDLRRYVADQPITARPQGVTIRLWRLVCRNRLSAASLALCVISWAGLIVAASALWRGPASSSVDQPAAIPWPEALRPIAPREVDPVDLADALNDLGRLYREIGRPVQAEAACRRSAEILRRLAEARPDVPAYRIGLAESFLDLAGLLRARGLASEADAAEALVVPIRSQSQQNPVGPSRRMAPSPLDRFPSLRPRD